MKKENEKKKLWKWSVILESSAEQIFKVELNKVRARKNKKQKKPLSKWMLQLSLKLKKQKLLWFDEKRNPKLRKKLIFYRDLTSKKVEAKKNLIKMAVEIEFET